MTMYNLTEIYRGDNPGYGGVIVRDCIVHFTRRPLCVRNLSRGV